MSTIKKEHLDKLNEHIKLSENSKHEAEILMYKAREAQLLYQVSDLQRNLFIHQLYIEYGLGKEDTFNNETGEITRTDKRDTEPPTEPQEQLELFEQKVEK